MPFRLILSLSPAHDKSRWPWQWTWNKRTRIALSLFQCALLSLCVCVWELAKHCGMKRGLNEAMAERERARESVSQWESKHAHMQFDTESFRCSCLLRVMWALRVYLCLIWLQSGTGTGTGTLTRSRSLTLSPRWRWLLYYCAWWIIVCDLLSAVDIWNMCQKFRFHVSLFASAPRGGAFMQCVVHTYVAHKHTCKQAYAMQHST